MRVEKSILAALVLIVSGCVEQGELPSTPDVQVDDIIRVATDVSSADAGNIETRAGATTQSLNRFRFFVTQASDASYNYQNVAMYKQNNEFKSYTDDTHATPLTMHWQDLTASVQLVATTQAPTNLATPVEVSVATDQSTASAVEQSDFLYFKNSTFIPSQHLVGGKVPISLKHQNAKFLLTIKLGTEFNTAVSLTTNPIAKVVVEGTKPKRLFNCQSGVWGVQPTAALSNILPYASKYTPGNGTMVKAEAAYECILIPQSLAAKAMTIVVTVGKEEYRYAIPAALTLAPNTEYSLTLSVGYGIVEASKMGFTPWGDGGSSNVVTG